MDAQMVRLGQRFVSHELYSWIVDEILQDGYTVPHVRLRALYDPEIVRIIACPVLLNPARFKPTEA